MASIIKRYGGKVDPKMKGKIRKAGDTHVYYGATFSSKANASGAAGAVKRLGANNARVYKCKGGYNLFVND